MRTEPSLFVLQQSRPETSSPLVCTSPFSAHKCSALTKAKMYNDDGLYRAPSLETHRSSQSGLQDLSNSSAEESAAQSGEGGIVAALEHVYRWAHYLGIWPQLGQLAEGR